jgi:hypothetical protein
MAVTPRNETRATPPQPAGLSLSQMVRLGTLGLASDIRDRSRDPALRKRPSVRALDPRLLRPIFIIGAPRSGTTFLGSCLGRMPEVSYHFEPRLTKAAARCVYDGSWSERHCARVFRTFYSTMLLAGLHGGCRFAEKNPENGFVVPFLDRAMPGAQFIHIIRDGRDAATSHAEQPWLNAASAGSGKSGRGGQTWGPAARWWVEPDRQEEFSQVPDIVRSAWCWRRFTEASLDGLATLSPERTIEVRYESVVSDPMGTADLLAEFLGTTPAGHGALREGLALAKPRSVGRWRKALDESQVNDVEREIGPLLAKLGYM